MRFLPSGFLIGALVLSGCGGLAPGASALPGGAAANPPGGSSRHPGAANYLYVTDPKVNALKVLDSSYTVVKTITSGLSDPVGDWVDANGNIYVANANNCSGGGNVVEYAHGSTSPTFTYSSGLICPLYVAVDGSGNVFTFDYGSGSGNYLVEYPQGQNTPVATWNTCNTGFYAFCYPTGIAMGPAGSSTVYLAMYGAVHGSLNLFWVADEVLYQFKSNNQVYVTGYNGPGGGVALDTKGNILVGAYPVPKSGSGGAARAPSGLWGIVKTKHKRGTESNLVNLKYKGFGFVSALALTSDQKTLYVADYGGATLTVLSYPKGKFVRAIGASNGLTDPDGVALGPAP